MTTEYRAITNRNGRPLPFNYIFTKPDVNWGGYFHDLRAHEVLWWESHEVNRDGSATAWKKMEPQPGERKSPDVNE